MAAVSHWRLFCSSCIAITVCEFADIIFVEKGSFSTWLKLKIFNLKLIIIFHF